MLCGLLAPPPFTTHLGALYSLTSTPDLGSYTYGAAVSGCASGTPASKPHAVAQAGTISYTYDCNGNLLSGGGRILTWDRENRPATIAHVSETYTYGYDADGERVRQHNGSVTTYSLGGGLWEEDSTGATTAFYGFNGQTLALRSRADGLTYLHTDHLGSVSATTDASGAVVSAQRFGPWGQVRSGGISQTSRNDTGQRLDTTGLLYYHARSYDPVLGRFISPDTLVPDPSDPQDFNRYGYAKNNPVRYNDPSGHCIGWVWKSATCRPIWETGQGLQWNNALDNVQTGLDVAGMIPGAGEPIDLVNAGISAARGNYGEAALSIAAMVPVGGQAATATKLTVKYGDEAAAIVKQADAAAAVVKKGSSFTPDTPVATADGLVPIGALTDGDTVLAYNEATGTTGVYTVTDVLIHTDPLLVHLTLDGEPIVTTPEHPFFVLLRGWVPAAELGVGDRVRNADGGYGMVQALGVEHRSEVMYNLTVATAHTFFVGEGRWLVHNTCPVSRHGAFREAKRDLGIPNSQQPLEVRRVPLIDTQTGRPTIGPKGRPVMTREYTYELPNGQRVIVQDHSAGHTFGQGGVGDQGPHFNVRPHNDPRGKVPGTKEHYLFTVN